MDETNPWQCQGKLGYTDVHRVKQVIKRMLRRGEKRYPGKAKLHHYKCRICGMWHIGSDRSRS